MLDALRRNIGGDILQKVSFEEDAAITRIVSSWPSRIDNHRALDLGFFVDTSFDDFIVQFTSSQKQVER